MSAPLLSFTVPGKPQPRQRARKGRGGHWYTPAATRQWQQLCIMCLRRNAVGDWTACLDAACPVRIHVRAYMPDRRVRDLDGVYSNVLDALKKAGVIADDRWTIVSGGSFAAELDRENPRTEVEVWRVE